MRDLPEALASALGDRYSIERELGEGGMATVYLATDRKHDRQVAIKVLKPELAAVIGAERFLAEIKTTANLQHPHILPLHDSGEADGLLYFVMPYVEGESLEDRIKREKQLPVDDAVRIASEVADALEYAHGRGVIHRDIKPANILLHEGRALVADFGIALAVSSAGGTRLTETGLSVGTPQYMSPEQASGDRELDGRSDLYSLAAVLYEMLAGEPPHSGPTAQAVFAKVLTEDPRPLTELRPAVPAEIEAAVHGALQKLPADRFGSVGEFAWGLSEPGDGIPLSALRKPASYDRSVGSMPLVLAAIGVAFGFWGVWQGGRSTRSVDGSGTTYLTLGTPPEIEVGYSYLGPTVAISPDGRRLVSVASDRGRRLYLQDLDGNEGWVPIAGTAGGANPFFSPDGEWVGFVAGNHLYKVSLRGGEPIPVVEILNSAAFRGAAWSPDGEWIYYAPQNVTGIRRVHADGGASEELTTPRGDGLEHAHRWPDVLPGGRHVLFTACCDPLGVFALEVESGDVTPVLPAGFSAKYVASGHLVFGQGGNLLAAPFDPNTLEVGPAVEILDDVVDASEQVADFDVSRTGSLIYVSGVSDFDRVLVRRDRAGNIERLAGPSMFGVEMSFHPDGDRLALSQFDGGHFISIFDFDRGTLTRFLNDPLDNWGPFWSRDGTQIAFSSGRRGHFDLYVAPADRSEGARLLHDSEHSKWIYDWSPDGRLIFVGEDHPETGENMYVYSLEEDRVVLSLDTDANEWSGSFSPDGRWLAYASTESGTREVYVVPFPGPGPRCVVSRFGGTEPVWSADGNELFFRGSPVALAAGSDDLAFGSLMVADVSDRDFCDVVSEPLFDGIEGQRWTVSPDGQTFVALEPRPAPRLKLIQGLSALLESVVP